MKNHIKLLHNKIKAPKAKHISIFGYVLIRKVVMKNVAGVEIRLPASVGTAFFRSPSQTFISLLSLGVLNFSSFFDKLMNISDKKNLPEESFFMEI